MGHKRRKQKSGSDTEKREQHAAPLNHRKPLFGQFDGQTNRGKKRRSVKQHRHMRGGCEAKSFGHEKEFTRKTKRQQKTVAPPQLRIPFSCSTNLAVISKRSAATPDRTET